MDTHTANYSIRMHDEQGWHYVAKYEGSPLKRVLEDARSYSLNYPEQDETVTVRHDSTDSMIARFQHGRLIACATGPLR